MASTPTQTQTDTPFHASVRAGHGRNQLDDERVFVVGYDGSATSRFAIAEAARRSEAGGRVIIVRSVGSGRGDPPVGPGPGVYGRAVASLLAAVRSEIHNHVPYEIRVVSGDRSTALAEVVRRHHAAELVSGRRGGRAANASGP